MGGNGQIRLIVVGFKYSSKISSNFPRELLIEISHREIELIKFV